MHEEFLLYLIQLGVDRDSGHGNLQYPITLIGTDGSPHILYHLPSVRLFEDGKMVSVLHLVVSVPQSK